MRDDNGSDQSRSSGGGEKWSDSGHILKVEPKEFQHGLDAVCIWEGEDSRMAPRLPDWTTIRMILPWEEKSTVGGAGLGKKFGFYLGHAELMIGQIRWGLTISQLNFMVFSIKISNNII